MRTIYVAGINCPVWTRATDTCRYWMLSVTDIAKPTGEMRGWLETYLRNRMVRYDPGTFMEDAISYIAYRRYLERYADDKCDYLQYDEIGDAEATAWYLKDMRRRGFSPIPVYTPGGDKSVLAEPIVAIGGLVKMDLWKKYEHLDGVFYNGGVEPTTKQVHLLGVTNRSIFERYPATHGDGSTWLPRDEKKRRLSFLEWMDLYGEQEIAYNPPQYVQERFVV